METPKVTGTRQKLLRRIFSYLFLIAFSAILRYIIGTLCEGRSFADRPGRRISLRERVCKVLGLVVLDMEILYTDHQGTEFRL